MIWIEMSRDDMHGGGEWGFAKCLWSPAYKQGTRNSSWLFWNNILQVQKEDVVIHLRGKGHKANFVGYSVAATDGHETLERPPHAGMWGYATSFFRVLLKDYQEFEAPINLHDFFTVHKEALITYLHKFQSSPTNRFFVLQSNRLQCLNGAYLSKCDEELLSLILNREAENSLAVVSSHISTSEIWRKVKQRVGQTQFSDAVKKNYHNKCCFPGCKVNDPKFLVGSHIARWVDTPDKRGSISNGLCLCVLHDKAFENGYFSLDDELRIIISYKIEIQASNVFIEHIKPFEHEKIDFAEILPDKESIKEHRFRCKISI